MALLPLRRLPDVEHGDVGGRLVEQRGGCRGPPRTGPCVDAARQFTRQPLVPDAQALAHQVVAILVVIDDEHQRRL
jgi:hypothetical protein